MGSLVRRIPLRPQQFHPVEPRCQTLLNVNSAAAAAVVNHPTTVAKLPTESFLSYQRYPYHNHKSGVSNAYWYHFGVKKQQHALHRSYSHSSSNCRQHDDHNAVRYDKLRTSTGNASNEQSPASRAHVDTMNPSNGSNSPKASESASPKAPEPASATSPINDGRTTSIVWTSGKTAWTRLQPHLERVWTVTQTATSKAAQSAGRTLQSMGRRGANNIVQGTRSRLASSRDWMLQLAKSVVQSTQSRISTTVTTGLRTNVTQPLQESSRRLYDQWQSRRPVVWNRFWWWSLAAIGVYGIATTVPKEIVKQILEPSSPSTRQSNETSAPSTQDASS